MANRDHLNVVQDEKKTIFYYDGFELGRVSGRENPYTLLENLPHIVKDRAGGEVRYIYVGKNASLQGCVIASHPDFDDREYGFFKRVKTQYGGDLQKALEEDPDRPVGCGGAYITSFYKDGDGGY